MWFKNLQVYRLGDGHSIDLSTLADQLEQDRFEPCSQQNQFSLGWTSPYGKHHPSLVHQGQKAALISLRREDKVIPAAVIRDMVEEKAAAIEAEEQRRVYRKEKEQFKEEILFECLPKALRKSRRTQALIDLEAGLIIVDAASPTRAEELTSTLRQSLGSLPLTPIQYNFSPAQVMTQWVSGEAMPPDWQLGQECELREPGEEGAILRCRRHDLLCDEIQSHLEAGKQVSQLALSWRDQLQFLLTQDATIKRLSPGDDLKQEAKDSAEDPISQIDAEFSLLLLSLRQMLPELASALGELKQSAV